MKSIYWNKLRKKVHLVGSYYVNISRCTVHIMSNLLIAFGYICWSLNNATYRFKRYTADSGGGEIQHANRGPSAARIKHFLSKNILIIYHKWPGKSEGSNRLLAAFALMLKISRFTNRRQAVLRHFYQHEDSRGSHKWISDHAIQYSKILDVPLFE